MKRPQRHIVIFILTVITLFTLGSTLLKDYIFTFIVCLMCVTIIFAYLGRDVLIARFKIKQRNWSGAIESYQKFEAFLNRLPAQWLWLPAYMSMYTFNPLSLTKNNLAVCYLNKGEISMARELLHQALELDSLNALPHVNLAIVSAIDGDVAEAEKALKMAQDLGFKISGTQRLVRQILAKANETAGQVLS